MNDHLTFPMIFLIIFCIIAEAARELCFKQASAQPSLLAALRKPITLLGIVFWLIEIAVWAYVLAYVPLSIAFPLMSFSYVAIVWASAFVLKEPVNFRHFIGTLLITLGVICIGVLET